MAGLQIDFLICLEREARAREMLDSTEYILAEFVALFRSMQGECKRLEAEVDGLKLQLANTYVPPRLSR